MNEIQLKALGDRVFCETFKSLQLLGFTVLYYNFNMETKELTEFNNRLHKNNDTILEDFDLYDKTIQKIEKIWGKKVNHVIKEFPYRARVKMMGGLPKQKNGMQAFNMANLQTFSAIESFIVLSFSTLMEIDKKFNKTQMDLFWSNMKSNAENYSNGMTDQFIVDYFMGELKLKLNW